VTSFIYNVNDFPKAEYFPDASKKYGDKYKVIVDGLSATGTRPVPERIKALAEISYGNINRENMDLAFAASESVLLPDIPENADFDPDYPRLTDTEILSTLTQIPENKKWLEKTFYRAAKRYNLSFTEDLITTGNKFLSFLCREVSYWEADSFPLDAMMDLPNRFDWTFQSDAWSLREQLRREANIISKGWSDLLELSSQFPLFVILNQRTPTDYFCSILPEGASLFQQNQHQSDARILLYTDLKISSSEHRVPLESTFEGKGLEEAIRISSKLDRIPVLCDFSRRRFSRAFMRVAHFSTLKKWGIRPLGKLLDLGTTNIPEAKSPKGFAPIAGNPTLMFFDPWPISDKQIISKLSPDMNKYLNEEPQTKPWQDDRIGARNEMEIDEEGKYNISSHSWIVPVLGGWMRVDQVFKSRLGRFLFKKEM
jgi:hypothetical protein